MPKILIVEDDSRLCANIADCLELEGHVVEYAFDGAAGDALLVTGGFDLVILDWNLPGITGLELLKEYRARGGVAKVLMLTGKSAIQDKTAGLDSGADDYLTKPFDVHELKARVRALLRRPAETIGEILKCRGLELDTKAHQVRKGGRIIELFPKEFMLLEFFMRHPGETFSLESLQKRLWQTDSESSPDTLRVHIARLRSKISKPEEREIIRTIHRVGYMLDLD